MGLLIEKQLLFDCRTGTSDEKTVLEVVKNNAYEKTYFKVEPGETWLDLGANIGAFSCYAESKGATVIAFEPDPTTYSRLLINKELNKLTFKAHNLALTASNETELYFYRSKTNQSWRNSLIKNWGGDKIVVKCDKFQNYFNKSVCVKMDIEGAEMQIVEAMDSSIAPKKLVLEWSFDIDPNIDRYRSAVSKLETIYPNVKANKIDSRHRTWLPSWFPPAKLIYCFS